MRIRSRIIYPVSRPPFENGGLFVYDGKIQAVGDWKHVSQIGSGAIVDLGDSVLLPGLVNAHCHLDYTNMAGKIPAPKNFPDWIKSILALKAAWSYSEYAESWLRGAEMLLQSGTTLVADIESVPELIPDLWNETALNVFSFFEMTGVKDDRLPSEILTESLQKIQSLSHKRNKAGLSPHALYSTRSELLSLSARTAVDHDLLLTTHVAESTEEFEMFNTGTGPLYSWLKNQRNMSDCGGRTPVEQLNRCSLLSDRFLAVHVNYLGSCDAQLLAQHRCSVVHCPSSHSYFKHAQFPYHALKDAGVNLCLGTDSLASFSPAPGEKARLDMFLEMQRFAAAFPQVDPAEIIEMATVNGARALKLTGTHGELNNGANADFTVLPAPHQIKDLSTAILNHKGPVRQTWVSGQCSFESGK